MANKIEENIEIPENVTVSIEGTVLAIKGPKGEVSRDFFAENIKVSAGSGKITITSPRSTKRERKTAGSFKAHIKNALKGVVEGHQLKMKILSGHFPISVSASGRELTVKNFFGEKTPRKLTLPEGVSVKVKGDEIEIESCEKELVGAVMGSIEKLARRTRFDRRIFQDGIVVIPEGLK